MNAARVAVCLAALLLAVAAPLGAAQPVVATGTGQTRTLSDLARERKLVKPTAASKGTFSVAGASGMPVLLGPVQDAAYWAGRAETVRREAFWSDMSRSFARLNEPPPTPVHWFNGARSYHTQPSRSVGRAAPGPAPRSQPPPPPAPIGGGRTRSGKY